MTEKTGEDKARERMKKIDALDYSLITISSIAGACAGIMDPHSPADPAAVSECLYALRNAIDDIRDQVDALVVVKG